MLRTSLSHPLEVDFIPKESLPVNGRLGMTFAPGKKQPYALTGAWDRDLCTDLTRLKNEFECDVLVSLVEDHELTELMIESLTDECQNSEIEIIQFSIKDVSVPVSIEKFSELVTRLTGLLTSGKTVVVHCKGGLGRTGLLAASVLVAMTDLDSAEAIKTVRQVRVDTIETPEQIRFVARFEEIWKSKNTVNN